MIVAACSDDAPAASTTVEPDTALTAIVGWAAATVDPVVDDAGNVQQPVVYLAAHSGDTIDAGVQAAVVEATTDTATVRFADGRTEAVDESDPVLPVRDGGVLLVVGEMPEPARVVELEVEDYRSVDDTSLYLVELTATGSGATVTEARPG